MNCDRIGCSFIDGKRESVIYSFSLDKLPGHKKSKNIQTKQHKKSLNPILVRKHFILNMIKIEKFTSVEKQLPLLCNEWAFKYELFSLCIVYKFLYNLIFKDFFKICIHNWHYASLILVGKQ